MTESSRNRSLRLFAITAGCLMLSATLFSCNPKAENTQPKVEWPTLDYPPSGENLDTAKTVSDPKLIVPFDSKDNVNVLNLSGKFGDALLIGKLISSAGELSGELLVAPESEESQRYTIKGRMISDTSMRLLLYTPSDRLYGSLSGTFNVNKPLEPFKLEFKRNGKENEKGETVAFKVDKFSSTPIGNPVD